MLYDVEANNLGVGAPDGIFNLMMRNEEFKVFFKDRIYKHCFNDGVLSPNGPRPYHDYRMNEIFDAIVPETARWQPSSGRNLPWDRDDEWVKEWEFMKEVFWPDRTENLLNQFKILCNLSSSKQLKLSVLYLRCAHGIKYFEGFYKAVPN